MLHADGNSQAVLQQRGQWDAVPAGEIRRRQDQPFVGDQRTADGNARAGHRPVLGQQDFAWASISAIMPAAPLGLRGELRAGDDLAAGRAHDHGRFRAADVKAENAVLGLQHS